MGLEGFTNVPGTHQGCLILPWWSDGGTNACPRQPLALSCRYWWTWLSLLGCLLARSPALLKSFRNSSKVLLFSSWTNPITCFLWRAIVPASAAPGPSFGPSLPPHTTPVRIPCGRLPPSFPKGIPLYHEHLHPLLRVNHCFSPVQDKRQH